MRLCEALFVFLVFHACAEGVSGAQSVPGSKQARAERDSHDSCAEEKRAGAESGEGPGVADPATCAGYPGPCQVLALAGRLKLSAEQMAALRKIQDEATVKAAARAKEIRAAEARLEEMFRQGRPEADLREQSFRADSIRAELRWARLAARLATRALLTSEQLAAYQRLPHSPGNASSEP